MSIHILRDLRLSTKLLILVEIKSQPRIKLRDLAEKLDITMQGVSEYLKLMVKENLIGKLNGDYRLTQQGVEFLHKNMSELKNYVDANFKDLDIINACTAIAAEDLENGNLVSLEMIAGELVAKRINGLKGSKGTKGSKGSKGSKLSPGLMDAKGKKCQKGKKTSQGQVLYSAKAGEEVAIVDLKGIVEFDYGTITLFELPSILVGGSRALDLDKVKAKLKTIQYDKLVVSDAIGKNLFNKLRIKPDIEFSAVNAALEAAQKGLNVLIATPTEILANTIASIEENNVKLKKKIDYITIPLDDLSIEI